MRITDEISAIMNGRFGKDTLLALATVENGLPYVRTVDAYYEQGIFYFITYNLSNKMRQIRECATVAVSGEWFTAQGTAQSLGYFGSKENEKIALQLKNAFAEWIDNGHNDFTDRNTIICAIKVTKGVLYANNKRYVFDEAD